ncbi:MAG: Na/Pi cotransporter family protein, partial [Oscillospiraceae bacterium]|nr:Na/Pi cotransporter family protein [Oscillospiraceae bacterium]
AHREMCRMGEMALGNLRLALEAFYSRDSEKAAEALEVEDAINYLNHQITAWLVHIKSLDLSEPDVEKLGMMLRTVSDIERIGDHAENIAEYALLEEKYGTKFSQAAKDELHLLSENTLRSVTLALDIFESRDESRLEQIKLIEDKIDGLAEECVENHIQRLKDKVCDPRGGVVFTDMVSDLERCSDHAMNIAYSILGETTRESGGYGLRRVARQME